MSDDYFTTQLTGTACAPRNCAAASGAMALADAGGPRLTADQFRGQSGSSCVPGAHSASGGLFISDVERVIRANGQDIDYGRDANGSPRRWKPADFTSRLPAEGAVLLGDYDALWATYRASATFLGDHSVYVHDYRTVGDNVCWHDPLRRVPIRIPASAAIA